MMLREFLSALVHDPSTALGFVWLVILTFGVGASVYLLLVYLVGVIRRRNALGHVVAAVVIGVLAAGCLIVASTPTEDGLPPAYPSGGTVN